MTTETLRSGFQLRLESCGISVRATVAGRETQRWDNHRTPSASDSSTLVLAFHDKRPLCLLFCFLVFFSQNSNWQNAVKLHDPLFHVWVQFWPFVSLKVDRFEKDSAIFKCGLVLFSLSWAQSNRARCVRSDSRRSCWRRRGRKSRGRTPGPRVRTDRDRPWSVTPRTVWRNWCETSSVLLAFLFLTNVFSGPEWRSGQTNRFR